MRPTNEWLLFDSKTKEMRFHRCRTQKEAIIEALEKGIVPRKTDDVRPRTGDATLMSTEEFEEFMDEVTK